MKPLEAYLQQKLDERKAEGKLRELRTQRAAVDFFSNDYLGVATNRLLTPYLQDEHTGTGATGSRLLSGNSEGAEALEIKIAQFHNAEAALLFNSGYDANTGLISALGSRHSTIIYDELCHASIIDGTRLTLAAHHKFKHNDLAELEKWLQQCKDKGPVMVVCESVYSMDGDMAPLKEMAALCEQYDAALIVDEAHATGVFGPKGAGLVSELGLENKVFARVHTYGKAMGGLGAAVLGSRTLKQYLINYARSFIYTTALPGQVINNIDAAYNFIGSDKLNNKDLHELIAYFRMKVSESGIRGWKDSRSQIQALVVGGNEKTKTAAGALQAAGLQVNAILHPTVPEGEERLRVCLHAYNTKEEVDRIFAVLKDIHA